MLVFYISHISTISLLVPGSCAFHTGSGEYFSGKRSGALFGPPCEEGDVIGCGVIFPRDYRRKSDTEEELKQQGGGDLYANEPENILLDNDYSSDSEEDNDSSSDSEDDGERDHEKENVRAGISVKVRSYPFSYLT